MSVIGDLLFSKILVKSIDFDSIRNIMGLERHKRGNFMATIKDVAQAAQVSAAAVSRVLNKDDNISVTPEVRARIFQAAHALGYEIGRAHV